MSRGGVLRRGDVYWADLGSPVGSGPGKRRPVVVLQSDAVNRSALATVVVASITSNTAVAEYPGNVFLPASHSDLARDSVVNVTSIATVDRTLLIEYVSTLPPYVVSDISSGVRLILEL